MRLISLTCKGFDATLSAEPLQRCDLCTFWQRVKQGPYGKRLSPGENCSGERVPKRIRARGEAGFHSLILLFFQALASLWCHPSLKSSGALGLGWAGLLYPCLGCYHTRFIKMEPNKMVLEFITNGRAEKQHYKCKTYRKLVFLESGNTTTVLG